MLLLATTNSKRSMWLINTRKIENLEYLEKFNLFAYLESLQ